MEKSRQKYLDKLYKGVKLNAVKIGKDVTHPVPIKPENYEQYVLFLRNCYETVEIENSLEYEYIFIVR